MMMSRRVVISAALLGTLLLTSLNATAQSIDALAVTPSVVAVNARTTVTFTVSIGDVTLVRESVHLVNASGSGRPPSVVGRMFDDGSHGDAVGGDGVFTAQTVVNEKQAVERAFAVAATFRRGTGRVLSSPVLLRVWPAIANATVGVTVNHPPTWLARTMTDTDVLNISNVETASELDEVNLSSESLFHIGRRRNLNPSALPIDQWLDAFLADDPTWEPDTRMSRTIGGRPAVRVEVSALGRAVRLFVADGRDVIELSFIQNSNFDAMYEQMLTTVRFTDSGVSMQAGPGRQQIRPRDWLPLMRLVRAVRGPSAGSGPHASGLLPSIIATGHWASSATPRPASRVSSTAASALIGDAVDVAIDQLTKPYLSGGKGPNSFDCSGLTAYSYANATPSIHIPAGTKAQFASGQPVTGAFQRGDLLFWAADPVKGANVVSHVGIYVDGNRMIHANGEGGSVREADISLAFWRGTEVIQKKSAVYKGARRYASPLGTLSVTVTGSGVVVSSPGGIQCPGPCVGTFPITATIQLAAQASSAASFQGWGGECAGQSSCTVVITGTHAVTATFSSAIARLQIAPTNPEIRVQQSVGLTAAAFDQSGIQVPVPPGSYSWSSDASQVASVDASGLVHGISPGFATITVTHTATGVASSTLVKVTDAGLLTVVVKGPGRVRSTPGGIDCPGVCQFVFATTGPVPLDVTPDPDATFVEWSGDCTGPGVCAVDLTTAKTVTAQFKPPDDLQVEGQNRVRIVGSWRIVFVDQQDNFALDVRTSTQRMFLQIDEDDPLLPPIEIMDNDVSGWTVDVTDWGLEPGQAYVEADRLDENTYLVRIEVTHGPPIKPYDENFLRFERIPPPVPTP
jgi:cell wall-associated NlpC family hydrolase